MPLRSMLRHHIATQSTIPVRLLYSARSMPEVVYQDEVARLAAYDEVDMRLTLTREWPDGWRGYRRRIDAELLGEISWPTEAEPLIYICGSSAFVETAANGLVELGHDPNRIKTERFGPTGS